MVEITVVKRITGFSIGMVSEVMIFVPSVARFRMTYFENRLAAGHIATAALEARATGELEPDLADKLLAHALLEDCLEHRLFRPIDRIRIAADAVRIGEVAGHGIQAHRLRAHARAGDIKYLE